MSCLSFGNPTKTGRYTDDVCAAKLPFSPVRKMREIRLNGMARSENVKIREAAASHPDLDKILLWELIHDNEKSVRAWAARNPNIPERHLKWIAATESDPSIRAFAKWRLTATRAEESELTQT